MIVAVVLLLHGTHDADHRAVVRIGPAPVAVDGDRPEGRVETLRRVDDRIRCAARPQPCRRRDGRVPLVLGPAVRGRRVGVAPPLPPGEEALRDLGRDAGRRVRRCAPAGSRGAVGRISSGASRRNSSEGSDRWRSPLTTSTGVVTICWTCAQKVVTSDAGPAPSSRTASVVPTIAAITATAAATSSARTGPRCCRRGASSSDGVSTASRIARPAARARVSKSVIGPPRARGRACGRAHVVRRAAPT